MNVTGLCIDKDICEYGTKPALTFYDASGAQIASYNETQLRKMVTDAAAAANGGTSVTSATIGQKTGGGQVIADLDGNPKIAVVKTMPQSTDANVTYLITK